MHKVTRGGCLVARSRENLALLFDLVVVGFCILALVFVLGRVFVDTAAQVAVHPSAKSIGTVERRTNEVRRRGDRNLIWDGISVGAPVFEMDAVFVGPNSSAIVVLEDGTRIDIDAASMVVFTRKQATTAALPPVAVDILRGGAAGTAGKSGVAMRAGRTSTGLQAGSKARVSLIDGQSRVSVQSGTAAVQTGSGNVVQARSGEQHTIHSDGKTDVVLSTISLTSPQDGARLMRQSPGAGRFEWERVSGLGPYIFELAADPSFVELAANERTVKPLHDFMPREGGVFYWRVRRHGRKGWLTSEQRKVEWLDDRAPLPFRPESESVVDLSMPSSLAFAWGSNTNAQGYLLEIARGVSFNTPLFAVSTDGPSHILRPEEVKLEEGRYCYRVRAGRQRVH